MSKDSTCLQLAYGENIDSTQFNKHAYTVSIYRYEDVDMVTRQGGVKDVIIPLTIKDVGKAYALVTKEGLLVNVLLWSALSGTPDNVAGREFFSVCVKIGNQCDVSAILMKEIR